MTFQLFYTTLLIIRGEHIIQLISYRKLSFATHSPTMNINIPRLFIFSDVLPLRLSSSWVRLPSTSSLPLEPPFESKNNSSSTFRFLLRHFDYPPVLLWESNLSFHSTSIQINRLRVVSVLLLYIHHQPSIGHSSSWRDGTQKQQSKATRLVP